MDEPIYRRLPCFMIATVDKFAAMPWTGEVGAFFGRVTSYDKTASTVRASRQRATAAWRTAAAAGSGHPGRTAPDLRAAGHDGPACTRRRWTNCAAAKWRARRIRPKIVASTATVRRAENQIRALFNRRLVDIFPPPGPDRRDSFFAEVHSPKQSNARLYVGVAAQGRSPKVVMLRVYLVLLAAAQKAYVASIGVKRMIPPIRPIPT